MRLIQLAVVFALIASPAFGSPYEIVHEAAERNGVPPALLHGIVMVESGYNCRAYNRSGHAMGIGQVLRQTARAVGIFGNLFDCRTGAEAAARVLRIAIARGGTGCAGMSLYNRGVWARPRCTRYGMRVLHFASR